MDRVRAVLQAVAKSRRYHAVDPELVRALAADAVARTRSDKEATKRVKTALHQVVGAFLPDRVRWARLEQTLGAEPDRDGLIAAMAGHLSSRERVAHLDGFHAAIFGLTGLPSSVLDLGCGLHPLSVPWMGLPDGARYVATDVEAGLVGFVGRVLPRLGVTAEAAVADALHAELPEVELAFLLKLWPTLEQLRPGAALALLDRVPAPVAVVSFPRRSLGGRAVGMATHYRATFEAAVAGRPWRVASLEHGEELVFVVWK